MWFHVESPDWDKFNPEDLMQTGMTLCVHGSNGELADLIASLFQHGWISTEDSKDADTLSPDELPTAFGS